MDNTQKKDYLSRVIPEYVDNYFLGEQQSPHNMKYPSGFFIPNRLFKYYQCKECVLDTIRNKEIWLSSPSNWDDDSDSTVYLSIEREKDEFQNHSFDSIIEFGKRLVRNFINAEFSFSLFTIDQINTILNESFINDQFVMVRFVDSLVSFGIQESEAETVGKSIKKMYSKLKKGNILAQGIEQITHINTMLRERMLGACFSEVSDDDHMWKEYANEGAGFCVEYSFYEGQLEPDKLEDPITAFLPIYYGDKDPISVLDLLAASMEFSKHKVTNLGVQFINRVFMSLCTKKVDWLSQREWRIWSSTSKESPNNMSFPFATGIIIGENMREDDVIALKKIAQDQNLSMYKRTFSSLEGRWKNIPIQKSL